MKKIVFRVDSSAQMGMGHLMRCLTLAHELKNIAKVYFISRELPGNVSRMVEECGFCLYKLPYRGIDLSSCSLHQQWLCEKIEVDLEQTKKILEELGPVNWLIVDNYALEAVWEKPLRGYVDKIMVIDDLADREHDCELLLDQNYYRNMDKRYDDLVPSHCQKLLGPAYALLRPEFIKARGLLRKRDGFVRRILVFFGGSDQYNLTEIVLSAILQINKPEIHVDVVVGVVNPNKDNIKLVSDKNNQFHYHYQVSNMAELMIKADLAIGAGGSTTWERCCLGLPSLVISLAKNQEKLSSDAAQLEVLKYLGRGDEVDLKFLADTIRSTLSDKKWLKKSSLFCLNLVDGNGVALVCNKILGYN